MSKKYFFLILIIPFLINGSEKERQFKIFCEKNGISGNSIKVLRENIKQNQVLFSPGNRGGRKGKRYTNHQTQKKSNK